MKKLSDILGRRGRQKRHKMLEEESFSARLRMEAEAQSKIDARLQALEIKVKNETRRS